MAKITIEFEGEGSASFSVKIDGATPLQVYLATHFVSLQAEEAVKSTMRPMQQPILTAERIPQH